jgi:WD40 repeat protein
MIPLQTAAPHPVSHIVFSPDGSTVAVAQPHHGVTLIERATGRTVTECAMRRRSVLSDLAFFGENYLVAAHAKGVEVFDTRSGSAVLRNHHYPRRYLLATRGDAVLGATQRGGYTSINPILRPAGAGIAEVHERTLCFRNSLQTVAFAPDGSHALAAESNRYTVLDVVSDRTLAEFEVTVSGSTPPKRVAAFCPSGRRFGMSDGRSLDLFDLADASSDCDQHTESSLVQRANAVAVAPMPHTVLSPMFRLLPDKPTEQSWYPPFALAADGRGFLVKHPRNRVQLWDVPTGTLVNEWSWRFEWVTCVALSADGLTAVAGGRFGRVLLWDLE